MTCIHSSKNTLDSWAVSGGDDGLGLVGCRLLELSAVEASLASLDSPSSSRIAAGWALSVATVGTKG
jgi:hypothetical protein